MPDRSQDFAAQIEDIPGTRVFTTTRARQGYWVNQFCMSLMTPENRKRWLADERAYLADWNMTDAQKEAVLARDYNQLLDLGGNIYYLAKVFS
ncbi:MAG: protocatechuate 4,5-dioxygenase subunit alpha, partial [Gammaproteobacteria bacterium]